MYRPHTTFERFQTEFYADEQEIDEHINEVERIITEINAELIKHETFDRIDFCDVSAGGIQIRLFTKAMPCASIGEQKTILHDWSNVDEVIRDVIAEYEYRDTPENIQSFVDFIDFGNKYGWD